MSIGALHLDTSLIATLASVDVVAATFGVHICNLPTLGGQEVHHVSLSDHLAVLLRRFLRNARASNPRPPDPSELTRRDRHGRWHVAVLVVMWLHASRSTASMVDSTTIDVYDVDTPPGGRPY